MRWQSLHVSAILLVIFNETSYCWIRARWANIYHNPARLLCGSHTLSCSNSDDLVITDSAEGQFSEKRVKGHPHSDTSRAKISAANKGKEPWNVGKQHSEETKRRIAEKTKEAMEKRKAEKLAKLGLTAEDYEEQKKVKRKEKKALNPKQGCTEETRRKMSDSAKKRWEDPEYRREYTLATKGKKNHTLETRNRISAAVKLKWKDEEYRSKAVMKPSEEMRAKISATLKARWQDPVFREQMINKTHSRSDEWKELISIKITEKWQDPAYRRKIKAALRNISSSGSASRKRSEKSIQMMQAREEMRLERQRVRLEERERRIKLKEAMKMAKAASKKKPLGISLKELLGDDIWDEEKTKRQVQGTKILLDADLEKQLNAEWSAANFGGDDVDEKDVEDDDDDDEEDEDDFEIEDFKLQLQNYLQSMSPRRRKAAAPVAVKSPRPPPRAADLIEVYDEDGKLVGRFTPAEYSAYRKNQ